MDESSLRFEGWRVAAASAVGVFFSTLPFYLFAFLLKPLASELSGSRAEVAAAYGVMTAAAALSAPWIGRLLDRRSARWVVVPGLALSGVALAALAALAPGRWPFRAVFALLGCAASGTSALGYSRAVATWFDRRRGMALALVVGGAAAGGVVHPPAIQALVRLAGWRGACLASGGAVLALALPVVLRFVRERTPARGGATEGAAGARVGEALRSRAFWILVVLVFGGAIASHAAIVHLSALLTDRGVPGPRAALAVSALGGAALAGRLLTGWLLDRLPAPRIALGLMATAALGTYLLASAESFALGVVAALLLGFGTGGEHDVTPYLLSRYFGLRSLSTLYGLTWTAVGLAGAAGPILMGRAFDATGSYGAVLVRLSAGMLGAAALLLALPPCDPRRPPDGG